MRSGRITTWICGALSGALLTWGAAQAEVRMENVIASKVLGEPVRYAVYLPPDYRQDKREYPVLYLLHGGGTGLPADWFTLAGIDQLLDRLIKDGRIRPVIAVAPDGRRDADNIVATYFLDDADGTRRWETMFFDEFMPAIEQRYPIIPGGDNRAILGISMGALAAIVYQLQAPDEFAGTIALSPAFRRDEQLLALSPSGYEARYGGLLGTGLEGADRMTDDWEELRPESLVAEADMSRLGRIPRLLIDLGAEDPFFAGAADLHLALKGAGIRHRFRVQEGGHDWVFWRAALKEALLHADAVLTRDYGE